MVDFNVTTQDWSEESARPLPKTLDASRLQPAWDEIAALSALAGRSFVTEDWSATEVVTRPTRALVPSELNRFEDLFDSAATAINSKLDISAARNTYKDEQQIISLIATHSPPPNLTGFAQLSGATFTGEISGTTARFATVVADNLVQTGQSEPGITEAQATALFLKIDGSTDLAGNLTPDSPNTRDLGSSTDYFADLFSANVFTGVVRQRPGGGALEIGANGENVAAEGNWTFISPTSGIRYQDIEGTPTAQPGGITETAADGRYVQISSLASWPVDRHIVPATSNATDLGGLNNRWRGVYSHNLVTQQINGRAIADYLSSSVSWDAVDGNILPTAAEDDQISIGQSGTVINGVWQGAPGRRFHDVFANAVHIQEIGGYPNSHEVQFIGHKLTFDATGAPATVEVDWTNTVHEGNIVPANDNMVDIGSSGEKLKDIYAYTARVRNLGTYDTGNPILNFVGQFKFADSAQVDLNAAGDTPNVTYTNAPWAGTDHTHEGIGGTEIDLNNLPAIQPAGDRAQTLGSQAREWLEIHGVNFIGSSFGANGSGTATFGGTGNTTRVRGATVSLTNVTELTGSAVTAITDMIPDTTALAERVGVLEGAGYLTEVSGALTGITSISGTDWSIEGLNTINGTLVSELTGGGDGPNLTNYYERNAALDPDGSGIDVGIQNTNEFRDGWFSRNVYAGIFQAQQFRPEATSGSSIGANSTDNIFAEGYIQTMRVRNLSALAGGNLTLNNARLAGTPVLEAALTGTADLGTTGTSLGNAYLTSVVSDDIQPDTSAGSILGANGNRWETIYGIDAVLTQLRGHNDQLTFGTDDEPSQILSANAADTTARTNFHLPGFQFHGTMEASQSAGGVSDYGRIGWLAQSITADSRPWRYGVFRKFVVTDDNTDIYGTDLEDDSAYPPGILLATRIQSSIRRGAGQGRFTDFLEIGVSNASTDSDSNRRQKLVGWWHIEEKGMRFGDANTPAILHGIQGQIDGTWKFNDDAVIDLNGANVDFQNVPTAWTQGGTGSFNIGAIGTTAIQSGSTAEDVSIGGTSNRNIVVLDDLLPTGTIDLGSNDDQFATVYTPSLRSGGTNALAIGGTESGNINMGQSTTTTTITASALTLTAPTTVGGHLTPSSGGSYNLGAATNGYWDNSYITNSFTRSIQSGGANVDLDIGEGTQNVLMSAPLRVKTSIQGESSSHDLVIGGSNTQGVDFQSNVDFTGVTVTGLTGGGGSFDIGAIGSTAIQTGDTTEAVTVGGTNSGGVTLVAGNGDTQLSLSNFATIIHEDLRPAANDSQDLGSNSLAWNTVYAKEVRVGNQGEQTLKIQDVGNGDVEIGQGILSSHGVIKIKGHVEPFSAQTGTTGVNIGSATGNLRFNEVFARRLTTGAAATNLILGGNETSIEVQSNLIPRNNEDLGTAVRPWTNIYARDIQSGTSNGALDIGTSATGDITIGRIATDLSIDSERVNVTGSIESGATDEDVKLGGSATRDVQVLSDVKGPDTGLIDIDHTNIRNTNTRKKVWSHTGGLAVATHDMTTVGTWEDGFDETDEMGAQVVAQAPNYTRIAVKFFAPSNEANMHWAEEEASVDTEDIAGLIGMATRIEGDRTSDGNGVSISQIAPVNIRFAWQFRTNQFRLFDAIGGNYKIEIWLER